MAAGYYSLTPLHTARIIQAPEALMALDFTRGALLTADAGAPWVVDVELDVPDLPHFIGGQVPMISERLLQVLVKAGVDNLQTFPLSVRRSDGAESRQHAAINVLGLVDATDLEASIGTIVVDGDDGPVRMTFERLVLSGAATRGLPLFRLFHDPDILVVDDRLRRVLDRQRPLEGWGAVASEIEVSDSA